MTASLDPWISLSEAMRVFLLGLRVKALQKGEEKEKEREREREREREGEMEQEREERMDS